MSDIVFEPANALNLREIVYHRIKEAIVHGLIPAGAKLSEIELSKQFDVSRTPVREAIRQLAETKLVTLTSRRGAYVLLPTEKDIADLFEIREALELLSVAHLCKLKDSSPLIEMKKSFEDVSSDCSSEKFMDMDTSFHGKMSELANNSYLSFILGHVSSLLQLCRHYSIGMSPRRAAAAEHIEIIDAIIAHDVELAKSRMKYHLDRTRDGLIDYVKTHPELTDAAKRE